MDVSEEHDRRAEKNNGPAPKMRGTGGKTPGHGDLNQSRVLGLNLSKQEAKFVTAMVRAIDSADGRVDPIQAAALAGYKDAAVSAYDLLGRPNVQEALRARAVRHVFGRLLPAALAAHEDILTDKSVSPSARMQAVRAVYELSGIDEQTIPQTSGKDGKSVVEMTRQELADAVEKGRQALGFIEGSAIDVTPDQEPTDQV